MQVRIDPPDTDGRHKILQLYSRGILVDKTHPSFGDGGFDAYLRRLAARAVGYVGADIAALCREAVLAAAPAPVTRQHFDEVFEAMGLPSLLRGVCATVPQCSWDDVGGLEEVKFKLKQASVLAVARLGGRGRCLAGTLRW